MNLNIPRITFYVLKDVNPLFRQDKFQLQQKIIDEFLWKFWITDSKNIFIERDFAIFIISLATKQIKYPFCIFGGIC